MDWVLLNQDKDELITERGIIYYRKYDKSLVYFPHSCSNDGCKQCGVITLGHYDSYEDAQKAIKRLSRYLNAFYIPTKEDIELCR